MSTQTKPIPQPTVRLQDIVTLTARLAQLLAEEVDLLGLMKIKEIEKLQHEKIFITNAIEAQRKLLDKHPGAIDQIPSRDKEDLQGVIDVFNDILRENHRKLLLAKEVNQKIVTAIKEVVRDHTTTKSYGVDGMTHYTPFETISVTLNTAV